MSTVPKTLYKYLSPDRMDILESMKIRFSPPFAFNDTFDAHYLVPNGQPLAKAFRVRLRNTLGVFCLTERPNNHLMWVHYAKNHTGFVVGFNARATFFREEKRVLDKVVYESGPKVFTEPDISVCFRKSVEWKYEQEWRCVREFKSGESRDVEIEPTLVTHIILGSQMDPWQIARIMQYASAYQMNHVQFLRSYSLPTSWTFENRPKNMRLCPTCSGDGYLE
jgi:hypothetical protein